MLLRAKFLHRMNSRTSPATPASDPTISGAPTLSAETQLLRRVTWKLVPLLFVCYVIAYIDRINVGFAKLHLQSVLGVDATLFGSIYGLGAGMFFIGYFIFEVPSNLILHRIGARIWIARIMIVWGIVSMAFMFMKGVTSFYILRFLLGAAEAGFFPGIILYFTYWYPPHERAQIIALFAIGGVAAGVVGSPISGALLEMDGMGGLKGWQWLFLLEGLPAVLLGVVVWLVLPNGPLDAKWLSEPEKKTIQNRLAASSAPSEGQRHNLRDCFTSPVVWLLCLLYFFLNVGSYGFEMWAPSIVKSLSGQRDAMVGVINASPYVAAAIVMYLVGRHSDLKSERRGHIAASAISAAVGFAIAASAKSPVIAMAGLTLAFAGLKSTVAPFWALTTTFLSGAAAAGGIALINSVGNLGGFFGPTFVGIIKDKTGSDFGGLALLGACLLGMGTLVFIIPRSCGANQKQQAATK